MALALRPLRSDSSMKSRWGSQALAVGLRPGVESGDALLAGFESAGVASCPDGAPFVTADAAKSTPKSGDTSFVPLAGFDSGACFPQPRAGRTAMPAALR